MAWSRRGRTGSGCLHRSTRQCGQDWNDDFFACPRMHRLRWRRGTGRRRQVGTGQGGKLRNFFSDRRLALRFDLRRLADFGWLAKHWRFGVFVLSGSLGNRQPTGKAGHLIRFPLLRQLFANELLIVVAEGDKRNLDDPSRRFQNDVEVVNADKIPLRRFAKPVGPSPGLGRRSTEDREADQTNHKPTSHGNTRQGRGKDCAETLV